MKKWSIGSPDRKVISKLMLQCGFGSLTAAALAAKGYDSPESVMEALNSEELSDPFLILDMKEAANTINEAVDNGEKICVYGDYDCDGIMATTILYTYLTEIGADVEYYIPERSEGYGLNNAAVDSLKSRGVDLIVTVDNGISAISEAEYIYSLGMKLVVTDHHQQGDSLPRAEAVVDPHRHDDLSPFKPFCGAAIALKLVAALDGGDCTLALEQFGDLAAIATIADIVSLTGENRFLTAYGLELISHTDRPALIALKDAAGISDKPIDSRSVGFGIAPRINAAGRCGSPQLAMELFLSEDIESAKAAAQKLEALNTSRKELETAILTEIYDMLDREPEILRERVIVIFGKGWQHGVVGLVCSRLTDRFGKPCFIASEENGEIRGSARAFGEFSVFGALTSASEALSKFGGHPSAGGFTVNPGMEKEFGRLLNEYARTNHPQMPQPILKADCKISGRDLTVKDVKELDLLEPFGQDNEKPVFLIENALVSSVFALSGGTHSKLRISADGTSADVLMFRRSPQELPIKAGDTCSILCTLGINEYKGNTTVSIYADDIRSASFEQDKYFAGVSTFESFMRGEQLPQNFYPAMLPTRDMAAEIYKAIPPNGIGIDSLYLRAAVPKINYCRFRIALEAMRELELISLSSADLMVRRLKVTAPKDLNTAPVLVSLRGKLAK